MKTVNPVNKAPHTWSTITV